MVGEIRTAIAASGTYKIRKTPLKATTINELHITASAAGSITISDGSVTDTIYVGTGTNNKFAFVLAYAADADITITAVTANVSIYGTYKQT